MRFILIRIQVLIKNMLYGTSDAEPQTDYVVAQLSQELYNSNLLLLLIQVSAVTQPSRRLPYMHQEWKIQIRFNGITLFVSLIRI